MVEKKDSEKGAKEYGAEKIRVLEGLDGVRLRPAMYIGSTSKTGLHHLVWEVIDNAVDEAMAGYCDIIEVTLNKDGSVTVSDNGRGIPTDNHPVYKRPAVEVAVTKLHAGGKFDKGSYVVSGGLHGVGISVVAALSKLMRVRVKRNGKIYQQEYKIGKPLYNLKIVKECDKKDTGTEITFYPDETIFSTTKFEFSVLETRFREIAFLNKGIKIILKDDSSGKKEIFNYEGGLIEFVKWVNKTKEAIHAKPVYFMKEESKLVVECAVQYNSGYQETVLSFVNTINTVEGGTHEAGFKTALTRAINDYANKNKLNKSENLTGDDVREGLTAIISVKVPEPQFEGQTKTKLGNSEVKGIVDGIAMKALSEFFEENPAIARRIVDKALEAQKARNAAKKAKELVRRKNAFSVGGLPGKLADCSSNKTEDSELFIVEGDSAAGCLGGDTLVALTDGRNLSLKDLLEEDKKGKKNFCYTIRKDGTIGVEEIINPRITKQNEEVIKVVLDNNQGIICTPDHKFMLKNGEYKEARYLTNEDSLMPLNRKISKIGGRITIDGYEMVWDPSRDLWIFSHMLADEFNLRHNVYTKNQGDARHHIDFKKLNNDPTNIIRISKEEHMLFHTQHLIKTLHTPETKKKAAIAHQSREYKKKMSDWANQTEVKALMSQNSKKLWLDQNYKNYMVSKFKEFYDTHEEYRKTNNKILDEQQKIYWANPVNRQRAAEKVRKFFEENPDARSYLSNLAKEQWKDKNLIEWRRLKTKEQWTPGFRLKRKETYNKTYYNKTISFMKKILEEKGNLKNFDFERIENNDKSILSTSTFCTRFFKGNVDDMIEAVNNWNHKIKRLEQINKKIDVYDIEIPETHNFALASGIFVHNSSKMGRNKEYQAILPLKGKPLNVEKSNAIKVLSNEEIVNIITAIGTGIGDQFNLEKLRYGKTIIMSVDGQETTFIQTPSGEIECVKIGNFIDSAIENKIDISNYKVLCFNLSNRKSQFKSIKAVIKHPISEKLYEIKTAYGRSVKVTSSHSVFVYENNEIKLKKGSEIREGDKIVAPRKLPLFNYVPAKKIDVLRLLIKHKNEIDGRIYVRGNSVEGLLKQKIMKLHQNNEELLGERVIIPEEIRSEMRKNREKQHLTQDFLCKNLNIKQPCVYYDWEKGKNKPTLKKFEKYVEVLGMNKEKTLSQVQIVESALERVWNTQYKNSGRNKVRDYVKLSELEMDDLIYIKDDVTICSEHYGNKGICRFISINEDLFKLFGFWVAEGSCSIRNGIRLSIGNNDSYIVPELSSAFKNVFGISPKLSASTKRLTCSELKLVNKVAAHVWNVLFSMKNSSSYTKKIPNLIFNTTKERQIEFLRTYFLGDGTISRSNISFTTVSKDLADQIIYLLQSFGVIASVSSREPAKNELITSKNVVYIVSVNSKEDLIKIKRVWESHRNSNYLKNRLESKSHTINRRFDIVSEDLIGLEIKNIKEVKSSSGNVYDFSVDEDENFIAGFGGLCCHNTDADVDGAHIRTLLLTFFFRFMPKLIENGNIYIAVSPLYKVRKKIDHYVYSDDELKKIVAKLGGNLSVQRFKGLGEMNPEQLWETTMNPKTRLLNKVVIEDAVKADEVFSKLMGDNVEPRKLFIAERASEAQIDI